MTQTFNLEAYKGLNLDKEKAKLADPRKFFLEEMGDLSGVEMFHNLVLVKIYESPSITAGGILKTDTAKREDIWQGVVGLVLQVGPGAFIDDETNKFHGRTVEPGDWVLYRTADTVRVEINGQQCRIAQDTHIRAKLSAPGIAY